MSFRGRLAVGLGSSCFVFRVVRQHNAVLCGLTLGARDMTDGINNLSASEIVDRIIDLEEEADAAADIIQHDHGSATITTSTPIPSREAGGLRKSVRVSAKNNSTGNNPETDIEIPTPNQRSSGAGNKRKRTDRSLSNTSRSMNSQDTEMEDQDLFTKMKTYMDNKFGGVDRQLGDMNGKVARIDASLLTINTKVVTNSAEIEALKDAVSSIKSGSVAVVRDEIAKVVGEELSKRSVSQLAGGEIERMSREVDRLRNQQSRLTNNHSRTRSESSACGDSERNYWWARRAIRIWPVKANSTQEMWKGAGDFFFDVLDIPRTNLNESSVAEVRRLETVRRRIERRPTRVHSELLVVFKDIAMRDMVVSFAPNLARANQTGQTAGLRMEIPSHLQGVFKTLDSHGHLLRDRHGPGLKRNIRFDDMELSLVMDLKLPDQASWMRVDYETAREELKHVQKVQLDNNRESLGMGGPADRLKSPFVPAATGGTTSTDRAGPSAAGTSSSTTTGSLPESSTLRTYAKPWGQGKK